MATDPNQNLDAFLGTPPRPWWRRWLKWGLIGIGVLLAALLLWHFFGSSNEVKYATDDVARGNLTVTVSATGKLAPTNQVTVGSQLSGRDLASANAAFVLCYGIGMLVGPQAIGLGMDTMGPDGFAHALAIFFGLYIVIAAGRLGRRPART